MTNFRYTVEMNKFQCPDILSNTRHSGQLLKSFIIWEPKHFVNINCFIENNASYS